MSVYKNQRIKRAEKAVAPRCEAAVARFLDYCQANPGTPFRWESANHPWSFRVTLLDNKWIMDDLAFETEGMEEFFEDEDLTSRDGVDHVICSVLVPLGIDVELGEVEGVSTDAFLKDLEATVPFSDANPPSPPPRRTY